MPGVKTPRRGSFCLPNVLAVQKSDSYRRVFLCLYSISDENSIFELDAYKLKELTGISRKTIYKVIGFLKRVNLLRLVEHKEGRGRHSIYQLNWRKPKPRKNCHPPKSLVSKRQIHTPCDMPISQIISPQNRQAWNRCMKAYREALECSHLPKRGQRLCVAIIGRHLKGKPADYAWRLYRHFWEACDKLKLPGWVKRVQDLCRWFMGVLRGLFKLREQKKRRQFRDYNEYLSHMHRQEAERVMTKRAPYEKSWEQRLAEWQREQEAERAWQKRQAELVRQRLTAVSGGG